MIADMKHRVIIKQAVLTPDGAGGFSESWQVVATVYAAITPSTAGEQLKFGQIEATSTHNIIIRYRTDVSTGMTLTDEEGMTYIIISLADPDGAKARLVLATAARSS